MRRELLASHVDVLGVQGSQKKLTNKQTKQKQEKEVTKIAANCKG